MSLKSSQPVWKIIYAGVFENKGVDNIISLPLSEALLCKYVLNLKGQFTL